MLSVTSDEGSVNAFTGRGSPDTEIKLSIKQENTDVYLVGSKDTVTQGNHWNI